MIKVSVMHPNTPGARFDHAYYRDKHMPLKARLGPRDNPARAEPQCRQRQIGEQDHRIHAEAIDRLQDRLDGQLVTQKSPALTS